MDAVPTALAVLPYVSAAVCLGGLAWRLRRWLRGANPPAPLFPVPDSLVAARARDLAAICRLGARRDSLPWSGRFPVWLFHAGLVLLAVGHIRAVTDFPRLWSALGLGPAAVDSLSGAAGLTVGLIALAALLALAARRALVASLRQISRFEDVFALALLLAVILSGLAMRLGPAVDLDPVRAYFTSLASLRPVPMPRVPGFALHFLLVQGLAVYAPFGKLLHATGVFPAKAQLDGDLPAAP